MHYPSWNLLLGERKYLEIIDPGNVRWKRTIVPFGRDANLTPKVLDYCLAMENSNMPIFSDALILELAQFSNPLIK